MSVQLPDVQALAVLDAITAAATGVFDGAKVVLFQNDADLAPGMGLGDLTLASFDGYAISGAVVWAAAGYDSLGNVIVVGGMKTFTCDDITAPNDVWGWALVDAAAAVLLWARKFPAPIPVTLAGQSILVLPLLTLGAAPDLSPNDVV